ncbi:hypothetical protein X474_25505 [Dethiosulfatarculus sandiegensis]|uniref:Uncharacterized protein n=1 Tax=Dethiosulfatarculus sandiegensis TaxID=1429043 RepID=A0A0D2HKN2_9BACT|nr:hypothetical protein X474_25505 [Dethiosulfatarculus sandiegensis]
MDISRNYKHQGKAEIKRIKVFDKRESWFIYN